MVMPRPVAGEDYVYKLVDAFATGPSSGDGEPNIQTATSDLLTRVATIYLDVDGLIGQVSSNVVRRLLQRLKVSLTTTISSASDAADATGAPVSAKAEYVLATIFPPSAGATTIP